MAIQTDRSGPAARVADALHRGILSLSERAHGLRAIARRLVLYARAFGRRIGLYEFLTYGPLIRLVSKTLLRRIMFANLIGLAVLLSGVFYLAQYRAGLIDAQGDSLVAQGESFASLIAFNATREEGTGRIILNPDMLPEIEGAHKLLRDETIAAMQLSIPPERVAPLFTGLPRDHPRPRLRHRRRADRQLRPALEERPADGPRHRRSRRPAQRPPARQDGLDALHGVAAARADPGLPRDRRRQRQVLPRGGGTP